MKNSLLIKLFLSLGLFGFFVDGADAGGGDAGADDFDVDIDDDADDVDDVSKNDGADEPKKDDTEDLRKQLQEQKEYIEEQKRKEAVNNTISELKTKHKDFDDKKILNFLTELHKTDPAKAEALNNPIGWENIHLTEFQTKEVRNDHPTLGRNVTPVNRKDKLEEKLNSGQSLSVDEQAEYFSL